ncbi:MAG: TrkA family potassium uptake protein [Bacillota bacterium]|nr:TrkA family potassium uptake protein [Bacillota bacterium]
MGKQYVVIGAGRFGSSVATKLVEYDAEVMVVDSDEEAIRALQDKVTYAVVADATDENALQALGLRNFDVAVVTIGSNIQSSILVTLQLKEMGIPHIVAKAQSAMHAKVLHKIGANRIVLPEREMGAKIARSLIQTNALDNIDLSRDTSIRELPLPNEWIGKTLIEIDMRRKYRSQVIGLWRGDELMISIDPSRPLEAGDTMVIIGKNADLKTIEQMGAKA